MSKTFRIDLGAGQLPEAQKTPGLTQPVAPPPRSTPANDAGGTTATNQAAKTPSGAHIQTEGDPINTFTGEEWFQAEDAFLPGPLPLGWTRHYRSSRRHENLGLGFGWFTAFHSRILRGDQGLIWVDPEGRDIPFNTPGAGGRSYQCAEGLCMVERDGWLRVFGPDGLHWAFEPAKGFWRLSHCTDPAGQSLRCRYDNQGRLSGVHNGRGRGLQLHYGPNGQLSALFRGQTGAAPAQVLARYEHDSQADLVRAEDPAGQSEHYHYRAHLITQRTTRAGFLFQFRWDDQARCIEHRGGEGAYHYRFHYQPGETRVTDAADITRIYRFDRRGLCTALRDGEGHWTCRRYDSLARLVGEQQPGGALTRYSHDDKGRLTQVKHADGSTERFAYNALNHPLEHLDRAGQLWQRRYDPLGRLRSLTTPEGARWDYHYDDHSQLTALTGPDRLTWRYAYNESGDRIAERAPDGALTEYLYDSAGQCIAEMDPGGQLRRLQFDARGHLVTVATGLSGADSKTPWADLPHHPRARLEHYSYDDAGRLSHYTDAAGRTTQYRYDGLNQPKERIDPAGRRLRFQYDHERRLVALTNALGQTATYGYNARGQVVKHRDFLGHDHRCEYDNNGNLIQRREGQRRHRMQYDGGGRLTRRTSTDTRTGASRTLSFKYDGLGRLTQAQGTGRRLRFAYNSTNQHTSEWQNDHHIQHRYDARGQRIHSTDGTLSVDYGYNSRGQLSGVAINGREAVRIEWDASGRELARQYANGHRIRQRHDGRGQLAERLWQHPGRPDAATRYQYDPAGRLQGIGDSQQGERHYDFDPAGYLKAVKGPWDERFQQQDDGTLERIEVSQGGHSLALSKVLRRGLGAQSLGIRPGTGAPAVPSPAPEVKFSHDAQGNIKQLYDGHQRLSCAYLPDNHLAQTRSPQGTVTYGYDALGRRSEKRAAEGITHYYWSGDVLWQEIREHKTIHYVFEPDSFHPLLKVEDGQLFFYHNDHLGTPQYLTDEQGQVVWHGTYLAYGGLAREEGPVENPLRFPGQYHDRETGLHYNRFRYYSPLLGRYIQPDPMGIKGGLNLYQYTLNPIQHTDPLGLCNESAIAATSATGAAIASGKDVTDQLPQTTEEKIPPWVPPAPESAALGVPYAGNASDGARLHEAQKTTWQEIREDKTIRYDSEPSSFQPPLKVKDRQLPRSALGPSPQPCPVAVEPRNGMAAERDGC